jgi:TolA-binding protein
VLGGCQGRAEVRRLSEKARALWEDGRYQDAARNFVTLSELYPASPLAEPSLFWAASLYHHYLQDSDQAIRHYQHLIVTYPKGRYFFEAKENLASIFEQDKATRYRALQVYQQLLLAREVRERHDHFQFKVGLLNMRMGKMDQARLAFRELLVRYPASSLRGETYYLVGYSYYLEKRYDLAQFAFQQTVKDFPGTPISQRASFFIADTLEERGEMREALKAFTAIKDSYPQPQIVEKRIRTLEARMRRGVR